MDSRQAEINRANKKRNAYQAIAEVLKFYEPMVYMKFEQINGTPDNEATQILASALEALRGPV